MDYNIFEWFLLFSSCLYIVYGFISVCTALYYIPTGRYKKWAKKTDSKDADNE